MRALSRQTQRVLQVLLADPVRWRHGYELAQVTGLASGSLYPILTRLAEHGLLEARWDDSSGTGPRRHLYRLSPEGAALPRSSGVGQAAALRPVTGK